jgi:hypothetical protein
MAVFNLAINYPDGEGTRIMTAMKAHYGVGTNAEAIEAFRRETALRIRTIVLHEERKSAVASVLPTNPS